MTDVTAWTTLISFFSGNTTYIKEFVKSNVLPTLRASNITDAKVIAATLGISLATYLYIKYNGTKEQNEVLQKELNRRRRDSEYSSLARRHRRSSSDSDSYSDTERHKRHATRRSRDSESSTPVKKNRRRGGTVRRRKSTKKR
jgi:hypothetical protein